MLNTAIKGFLLLKIAAKCMCLQNFAKKHVAANGNTYFVRKKLHQKGSFKFLKESNPGKTGIYMLSSSNAYQYCH